MISDQQQLFFLKTAGQDILFPSHCSAAYFFPFSFIYRIFFPQKGSVQVFVKYIYIYIVARDLFACRFCFSNTDHVLIPLSRSLKRMCAGMKMSIFKENTFLGIVT